jgi:hypothetical protein
MASNVSDAKTELQYLTKSQSEIYITWVWNPIYSNCGQVKCGHQPKKGINIPSHCGNQYSITGAPVRSVTHVLFWWCIYVTTFRLESNGGKYATRHMAWATGSPEICVRGFDVPSETSELSRTTACFKWQLRLLLMSHMDLLIQLSFVNRIPSCPNPYIHCTTVVARMRPKSSIYRGWRMIVECAARQIGWIFLFKQTSKNYHVR